MVDEKAVERNKKYDIVAAMDKMNAHLTNYG